MILLRCPERRKWNKSCPTQLFLAVVFLQEFNFNCTLKALLMRHHHRSLNSAPNLALLEPGSLTVQILTKSSVLSVS